MLPKITCPSCNQKTVMFISIFKNLFITNEGSKCSNCKSLILIKQEYKQILKYFIMILHPIVFILNIIYIYEPFTRYMNETIFSSTLLLIFINLIFLFIPNIIINIIYCYFIPIVEGTEEEIKKRNKIGIIGYSIEIGIIIVIVLIILVL